MDGLAQSPKLLDRMRNRTRVLQYSIRTEQTYVDWAKRFMAFHGEQHPKNLGAGEMQSFLSHLAVERHVSASTQNQAKAALLFLYKEVLGVQLPWLDDVASAKTPRRLPVVLTATEVGRLLAEMNGTMLLAASLLCSTGMRVLEALRLRVRDVDFDARQITVRDAKGNKDRVTRLPENLLSPMRDQLARAKKLHDADLLDGLGEVFMPPALAAKYSKSARAWGWQYVFASPSRALVPASGEERRHHIQVETLQRAVRGAASRAGIGKLTTPQVLRNSFATHLLQTGHDIGTVQQLLGHKDVATTQVYMQVIKRGSTAVRSPLDVL